jgi:hypothetical protein
MRAAQHGGKLYRVKSSISDANAVALLVKFERRLLLTKTRRRSGVIESGQQRCTFLKAKINYSVEIAWRDWTDRRLSASGNPSLVIENALLYWSFSSVERDWIGKIEIASGFNQSEIHAGSARIGNDFANLCNCKVTSRVRDLARLIIDNPIADTGFNTTQILAGKLILFSWAVVVNRVRAMDEYPQSHSLSAWPSRKSI